MMRIVLVAVLALLVPLQGAAAVAAGQCMATGHHQDGGGSDHSHSPDGADGHGDSHHDSHDDGKASHCGPCAACCASASIAGSPALPILATAADTKYLSFQLSPRAVQPHGIDRPPLPL